MKIPGNPLSNPASSSPILKSMAHTAPLNRSRVIFYAGLISAGLALFFLTLAYTPM